MNSNGDRLFVYQVWSFDPGNDFFSPYMEVDLIAPANEAMIIYFTLNGMVGSERSGTAFRSSTCFQAFEDKYVRLRFCLFHLL